VDLDDTATRAIPGSPPAGVALAVCADVGLAALTGACLLALYPVAVAVPIALFFGAALCLLASLLRDRRPEGYWFQLALLLALTGPPGHAWKPFGLLVPVAALVLWSHPEIRSAFGLAWQAGARHIPAAVAVAVILAVMEIRWTTRLPHPLLLGHRLGLLEPLRNPAVLAALLAGLAASAVGLLLRVRVAYLAAPALLAPVALAVHPLGLIAFPCFPAWLAPGVRASLDAGPLRVRHVVAALAPAVLGLLLVTRVLPCGTCPVHGLSLWLYPYRQSPIFAKHGPFEKPIQTRWDVMKVACPADELAVICGDEQKRCRLDRLVPGADPSRLACPYDALLRATIPVVRLPENRYERKEAGGRHVLVCATCSRYGRASEP
jgi:hypothetical protein